VKTLGGIWTRLFSALCLERLKVSEAVEVVFQRQDSVEKRQIEEAAYTLLGRIPDCGGGRGYEVAYEESHQEGPVSDSPPRGEPVEEDERRRMLHYLLQIVLGEEEREISEDGMEKLGLLHIELQPLDRMLLKLCFQEEMGVAEAGRMLGQTRFQAHGRMRRIMRRIRGEFERIGIDRELLLFLRD
jgi:DNA-directed RNA polymerase specialized sigma24 family protein